MAGDIATLGLWFGPWLIVGAVASTTGETTEPVRTEHFMRPLYETLATGGTAAGFQGGRES